MPVFSRGFLPVLGILAAAASVGTALPHFTDDEEPEVLAAVIADAMTDREALGQLLMFGYPGSAPDSNILDWINQDGLGAVKIFGWNAGNLNSLADTIGIYQKAAGASRFGVPLLIATDQEGGWVRHVKGGSSITPGNMALGADPVPADALETGRLIGRELASVGINMNFAPTIDVFVNPDADVIGPRAFMADPAWTGILGLSFAKGQQEFGVISTAKHFPGHGAASEDSHGTLPVVATDLDTLRRRDLVPYRTMITGGVPAIMAGHLAFPSITGDRVPATLSQVMLTDILRGDLGFDGVIVTDDLFMDGARIDGTPLPEVCYDAISAGADLILVSQGNADHKGIHRRLLGEMEDPDFNRQVRRAAYRVLVLKTRWLKGARAVPLQPEAPEAGMPRAASADFLLTQAARSITLIRGGRFPIPPEDAGNVLLAGSYTGFFREGLRRYPGAKTWRLPYEETDAEMRRAGRELAQAARSYQTVIVLLPDQEMAGALSELSSLADRVVVMSVLSPAHLDRLPWAETTLAAYGTGRESFRAAFAALAGDFVPEGRLPIPLETAP